MSMHLKHISDCLRTVQQCVLYAPTFVLNGQSGVIKTFHACLISAR